MQELKFFRIAVSSDNNYVEIQATHNKHEIDFNDQELYLLDIWYKRYSNIDLILASYKSYVYPFFRMAAKEIYGHPDDLKLRWGQLARFETALLNQIAYIKQPKF